MSHSRAILALSFFHAVPVTAASGVVYKTRPIAPVIYGVTQFGGVAPVLDENDNQLRDSFEETYELEPGSGAADADDDSDGLVNKDELAYGTDPSMADTDGDGASDRVEVDAGSAPLDPHDTATTVIPLASITVNPQQSHLTYNSVFSPPTLSLRVTAVRADDTTRDITKDLQTTYVSLSPELATVNSTGRVTALAEGTAQIVAQYRGRSDIATITIATFSPRPVAAIGTSGFAYRVAVHSGIAYVANGPSGLWLVDVHDPTAMQTLAQVALTSDTEEPGDNDARDVALWGDWAVVANGTYGLSVVDISNPNTPALLGRVELAGAAHGVAVSGHYAYVAAGSAGLLVVDIIDPTMPVAVASLPLGGNAHDLALDPVLGRSVIADDTGAVHLVDITQAPPLLLSTVEIPDGQPNDIALRGVLAWVSAGTGKVRAVDVAENAPVEQEARVRTEGLVAQGVDVAGSLLFVADRGLSNNLPIYSIPSASGLALVGEPTFVGQVDFGQSQESYVGRTGQHQGVTVSGGFVYVPVGADGLQIGQYAQFNDAGHVPPRVAIVEPEPNTSAVAGQPVVLRVHAEDDVAVASFELLWDLDVVATLEDDAAPTRDITVEILAPPAESDRTVVLLGARARDLNGNVGEASPVEVLVSSPEDDAPPELTVTSPQNATIAGGRAFLITAEATDDRGVAYLEVEDSQGVVRDRDYDSPYELVGVMPYEGELDQAILFTVRAVDFSMKLASETLSINYGGFSDEVVGSCVTGVPVFDLPDEGISGSTTGGSALFSGSCVADGGEPERIFAYTVRPDHPLRQLTFSTDDELTNYDTVLYVRFNSCADPTAEVCDDQSGGDNTSQVTIDYPLAGVYYVFVDGATAAGVMGEGAFGLKVIANSGTQPFAFSHLPTDAMWATSVLDYTSGGDRATEALGAPDTCVCAGVGTAWSPGIMDNQYERISVAFSSFPAVTQGVYVHETDGPGTIVSVDVATTPTPSDADWNQVDSGTPAASFCDRWMLYPFEATTNVQAVRLTLNTALVGGWNEIDAIGLKAQSDDPCGDCTVGSTCVVYDWGPECICPDGTIGGGPTCVPIAVPQILPRGPQNVVWPSSAIGASSFASLSPDDYSAEQAMTWDLCGCVDSTQAWAPENTDSSLVGEWIAVSFPEGLDSAYGVVVHETYGTGSIIGVDMATTDTPAPGGCPGLDWQPIAEQSASLEAACPRWVLYPLPGINLSAVRLRLDTAAILGLNQVDAIGVVTADISECAQGCDADSASCVDSFNCACESGYVGDGRLCVLAAAPQPQLEATPTDFIPSDRAIGFSSEYGSAEHVIEPDVAGCESDNSHVWSPLSPEDSEWIAVSFPTSRTSGVYVHETYGTGAIVGVDIAFTAETDICGDADWHPVYEGAVVVADCPRWLLYPLDPPMDVAAVRIRLDTSAPGFHELDAIGLKQAAQ